MPESAEPPAKFNWKHPDIYFDNDAPPSPGRTRSGQAYGTDRIHCLNTNDTHLAPDELQLHRQVVGDGPNGCPRRFVGIGWVPYTDAMAQVWGLGHELLGLNAFMNAFGQSGAERTPERPPFEGTHAYRL